MYSPGRIQSSPLSIVAFYHLTHLSQNALGLNMSNDSNDSNSPQDVAPSQVDSLQAKHAASQSPGTTVPVIYKSRRYRLSKVLKTPTMQPSTTQPWIPRQWAIPHLKLGDNDLIILWVVHFYIDMTSLITRSVIGPDGSGKSSVSGSTYQSIMLCIY